MTTTLLSQEEINWRQRYHGIPGSPTGAAGGNGGPGNRRLLDDYYRDNIAPPKTHFTQMFDPNEELEVTRNTPCFAAGARVKLHMDDGSTRPIVYSISQPDYKERIDLFALQSVSVQRLKSQDSSIKKPSTMSSLRDFYRHMTASPEDKLMRDSGLEDPIGVPTPEGIALLQEILYKKFRSEVIAVAERAKAEADKDKK